MTVSTSGFVVATDVSAQDSRPVAVAKRVLSAARLSDDRFGGTLAESGMVVRCSIVSRKGALPISIRAGC